ncbi:MAG: hypothetical protein AABX01_01710 [Candidatus Micrarchaeota archaeon]
MKISLLIAITALLVAVAAEIGPPNAPCPTERIYRALNDPYGTYDEPCASPAPSLIPIIRISVQPTPSNSENGTYNLSMGGNFITVVVQVIEGQAYRTSPDPTTISITSTDRSGASITVQDSGNGRSSSKVKQLPGSTLQIIAQLPRPSASEEPLSPSEYKPRVTSEPVLKVKIEKAADGIEIEYGGMRARTNANVRTDGAELLASVGNGWKKIILPSEAAETGTNGDDEVKSVYLEAPDIEYLRDKINKLVRGKELEGRGGLTFVLEQMPDDDVVRFFDEEMRGIIAGIEVLQ